MRFILFFRRRAKDKAYSSTDQTLSVTELQNAENSLIRYIQHKHFPECFLNKQCKLKSLPRSFQKLRPIVVDGVLRVGGRSKQAPFDLNIKHPIILQNFSRTFLKNLSQEPLTSNHLLLLRGTPNLPPGLFYKRIAIKFSNL